MKYKTDCPCYSEVNMGNPGGVPHCSQYGLEPDCENCKRPKRTKADRIRAMTDEELAEWLVLVVQRIIKVNPMLERPALFADWLDWLRQEAET